MKKENTFLYAYILVVVIKVGLYFALKQVSSDIIAMTEKFDQIENGTEKFKTFYDSLAGNPNFRKRLLDTVSTVNEIQQLRENEGNRLIKEIEEFRVTYPDREGMIMRYKIMDGLDNLLSVVFVCMAIPLIIHFFKRR